MHLHVLGSINLDLVSQVQTLPRPGETILALSTFEGPGGKGANQAKAAARFGVDVTFHGAVGADDAGRRLVESLVADGVNVSCVRTVTTASTGRAHVMVSANGENMIVVDPGANFGAAFQAGARSGASVFLAQLETPVEQASLMFQTAAPGDLCILNAAPATRDGETLFTMLDVLVLNRSELAVYGRKDCATKEEIIKLARDLITKASQHIVITLGDQGVVVVGAVADHWISGYSARVLDTTGAGDAFVGVMAASLSSGSSLVAAAQVANFAAALSVERPGADSAPTRTQLESMRKFVAPGAAEGSWYSNRQE
jgi:ribokinase